MNIISKISELNINAYYEPSNGYVVVWFSNSNIDKSDIVAYLQSDMSWDVREIIKESSTVYTDYEVVKIQHSPLGKYELDSNFDKVVRPMIDKMIESAENIPENVIKVKQILDRHSYNLVFGNN